MRRSLYKFRKTSTVVNCVPPKSVRDEIFAELELIKNTKPTIFLDEEVTSPKPGAVMKPTGRVRRSGVTSTAVSEPVQMAVSGSLIETPAEASVSSVVKTCRTVRKAKAIPKSSTTKERKPRKNSRQSHSSKANCTSDTENTDYLFAKFLARSELHLRSCNKLPAGIFPDIASHHVAVSPDVASPHVAASPDVASPDVASPRVAASPDVASPHVAASPDVASPHDAASGVASPHVAASPDVASPHDAASPDVASPHDAASPDVASPHVAAASPDVASPHDAASPDVAADHVAASPDVAAAHVTASSDVAAAHVASPDVTSLNATSISENSPIESKDTSAECMDQNSILSPEKPKENEKILKKIRKPRKISAKSKKRKGNPFLGSSRNKVYMLSTELAGVIGRPELCSWRFYRASPVTVISTMNFLKLDGSLQLEPGQKYIKCNDDLSKKIFAGERRILIKDEEKYLCEHLITKK